jgi:DNA mismatch repair ATPase MutS
MVLSGMGSVVCASEANVHLTVLVSMRLSDSSDSESYFFAEIKRLKQIMDELEGNAAFVLDEILRGTNSDDKRNGTIEVVKKVIANKAIGAIATHDIEVCLTTNEYRILPTNALKSKLKMMNCILITNCVMVSVEIKVLLSLKKKWE